MEDTEKVLHSARLDLEPLIPIHASQLYEQLQDPRIYIFESLGPPASLSEFEARIAKLATRRSPDGLQTWLNWAVRLHSGGYVGIVQTTITEQRAVIGYNFFPAFWGRGYAREACREMLRFLAGELRMRRFEAVVDTENQASIRLLEALGFTRVWTGPSDDLPGRTDHRYESHPPVE